MSLPFFDSGSSTPPPSYVVTEKMPAPAPQDTYFTVSGVFSDSFETNITNPAILADQLNKAKWNSRIKLGLFTLASLVLMIYSAVYLFTRGAMDFAHWK